MKINRLLIGMLASIALVGCSNDDELENNGNPALNGNSYLSVNLSMGNPTSRGTQGESFDIGTEEEAIVYAKNVVFLFYDASGNYVTQGSIKYYDDQTKGLTEVGDEKLNWKESSVELKSAPVIVLGPTKTVPSKVIAILNDNDLADKCMGENMNATLALTGNTTTYYKEGAGYVMSNSAYVDGNNVVYATDIAPDQICESAADAVKKSVNIYVERVAAKIKMSYADGKGTDNTFTLSSTAAGGKYMVNDEVATLKVKVAGWTINAINETSSLIKNINNKTYFAGWNSEGNNRSYWAEDVNYTEVIKVAENATPEPWEHTGKSFESLTYKTWADADLAGKSETWNERVFYLNENTMDEPVIRPNDKTNATTLLVVGHILVNGEGKTLFTYKGGYYTEENYKNILMGALSEYKKVDGEGTAALTADDFVWKGFVKDGKTYDYYKCTKVDYQTVVLTPGLASGVTLADGKKIEDIHGVLEGFKTKLYDGGRCYYQIPIKHIYNDDTDADVLGEYGIVRNHSYQLTLNNITNIGGAIFDPENEELDHIPGKENDYYISATLNVLPWRVVANQNVDL